MLTRQHKIGLVLAFLLGLSDLAILAAAGDDSADSPPGAVVVISVVLGVATIVLVALAWRRPTRPLMLGIIVLRALSGLGSLIGIGQGVVIAIVSLVFLALAVVCVWLLRSWLRRPEPARVG